MFVKKYYVCVLVFISGVHCDLHRIDQLKKEYEALDSWLVTILKSDMDINLVSLLFDKFYEFDQMNVKPTSSLNSSASNSTILDIEDLRQYLDVSATAYDVFIKDIEIQYRRNISRRTKKQTNAHLSTVRRLAKMQMDAIYERIEKKHSLSQNQGPWCNSAPEMYQHALKSLYFSITLAEFKLYFMSRFLSLLNGIPVDNLTYLLSKTKNIFQHTLKNVTIKNDIRRCDPERFIKGQNYIQFTKLRQGVITPLDGNTSVINYKQRCVEDEIISCTRRNSTGKVCVSSFDNRRYDYIREETGILLGKLQYCKTSNIKQVQEPYRICMCVKEGNSSDRYISLRPVLANVNDNRVITGLKFVKPHRILHLQAQEGELLPGGLINASTVRWIPIDDFNITDKGIYNEKDFFSFTDKSRTIAVDEIESDQDNFVITGFRFTLMKNNTVQLKINITEIDWANGKLNTHRSKIMGNNTEHRNLFIDDADIPTYTNKPSEIVYPNDPLFIQFTSTSWKADVAQSTIPFLDAQEVISVPPTPLAGAGLYYKGSTGYGGFIAPVIKTHRKFIWDQ